MSHEASFGIATPGQYFTTLVLPQFTDFLADNSSVRHALLATMAAYHMYEWVHPGSKFTADTFRSIYPSHAKLAESFEEARQITNGTKHFVTRSVKTRKQAGFSSAFSDGFAKPLVIVLEDGSEKSADRLLRELVEFWQGQHRSGAF
jgi:hypothetical protein